MIADVMKGAMASAAMVLIFVMPVYSGGISK